MAEVIGRQYVHTRPAWVKVVMQKYFPDWPQYEHQAAIFDIRGLDKSTIETLGILFFARVMPRADVIAWRGQELLVIEFTKQRDPKKVFQLQGYLDSIKHDEVRPQWKDFKLTAVLVSAIYDVRTEEACKRFGYKFIVEPEPLVEEGGE